MRSKFNKGDPIWFLPDGADRVIKGTVTGRFGPCFTALYNGQVYIVPPSSASDTEEIDLGLGYRCKSCGHPIERAIEGELICSECRSLAEMSKAEEVADRHMREYLAWASCHCESCGKELEGGGLCASCDAEYREAEVKLDRIAELEAQADDITAACNRCRLQLCETCEWCGMARRNREEAQALRDELGLEEVSR